LTITKPDTTTISQDLQAETPTITAAATSIAYTGSASVTVTESTPNTFNLAFDIPIGEPLSIDVSYASIADMTNNTTPTPSGYTPSLFDVAIIQSPEGAENVDNAKLYIYQEVSGTPVWVFMSDLSGAKGETGNTGPTGPMPEHQWSGTSLQFEVPEGGYGDLVDLKGDKGDNADDADINNTSTLNNLNSLTNQKEINEYFENNKVDKSGDTMTGDLTLDGSNIIVTDTNFDNGAGRPSLLQTSIDSNRIDSNADWYHFGVFHYLSAEDSPIAQYDSSGSIIFNSDFTMRDSSFDNIVNFDYDSGVLEYKNSEVATLVDYVAGVEEVNNNTNISFWTGTQAQYDLIATPDANTLYFITDN
jgi:hypothetical protein